MCRSCSMVNGVGPVFGPVDPQTVSINEREREEYSVRAKPKYGIDLRAEKRAEVLKRFKHAVENGNAEQLAKLLSEARGVNQSDTTGQAEYLLGVR